MPGALLWGWDATNKVWIPLQVDANGYVKVDMSNINLDDLADVSVAAPTDGDFFYWDDAASLWKPKAHANLTTGVHGVGARHVAETSVEDLDLADHVSRHRKAGGDPLHPLCLPDLVRQSNFQMIPTAAGWTEVLVGAGNVRQEPMRNLVEITDDQAGSALCHAAAFGFNVGGFYGRVNWDKRFYIIFNHTIWDTEANLNRRVQVKESFALGQLAQMGLGFQAVNLVMTGESYGTARGTVSLGNIVEVADPRYELVQVVIELDPATPAVNFYIDGSLVDSITNTDHIPSGIGGAATYLVHSIDRVAGGAAGVASVFMQSKIWHEL